METETEKPESVQMPYYRLFVRDELVNFQLRGLDLEEFGTFCHLRNLIWLQSELPANEKDLAKILRISKNKFQKIWKKIFPMFEIIDGKLTIPDLEAQRAKYSDFLEKQRNAGIASVEARRKKQRNAGSTDVPTDVEPSTNNKIQNTNNQNPYPQNSNSTTQTRDARRDVVDEQVDAERGFSKKQLEEFVLWRDEQDIEPIKTTLAKATNHYWGNGDLDHKCRGWLDNGRRLPERRNGNSASYVGKADGKPPLPTETEKRLKKFAKTIFLFVVEQKTVDEFRRDITPQFKNGLSQGERDDLYCAVQDELRANGFDIDKDRDALLQDFLLAI